jgi:hypothetical protein
MRRSMIDQSIHEVYLFPSLNLNLSSCSESSLNFSYLSSISQNSHFGIIHQSCSLHDLSYQTGLPPHSHMESPHPQSVCQVPSAGCHYTRHLPHPRTHLLSWNQSSLICHRRPFTASDRISYPPSPSLSQLSLSSALRIYLMRGSRYS